MDGGRNRGRKGHKSRGTHIHQHEAHDPQHNSAPTSRLARAPRSVLPDIGSHTRSRAKRKQNSNTTRRCNSKNSWGDLCSASLCWGCIFILFVKLRNMYVYTSVVKTKTNPRLTLKMAKNCCVMVPSSSGLQHPQMSNTSNVESDHRF